MRELSIIAVLALSSIVSAQQQYPNQYPSTNSFTQQNQLNYNNQPQQTNFNPLYQPTRNNYTAPGTMIGDKTSLQFAMRSYSNPGSTTPDGGSCSCPVYNVCLEAKCAISFTFVVFVPNQPTRVLETREVPLDENGDAPQQRNTEWGRQFVMNLPDKPSSIEVLVHHRGLTYDTNGNPLSVDKSILIDQFHVNLETVLPAVGGVQSMEMPNDYKSVIQNSRMSLAVSLSCISSQIGPHCDLTCTKSTINTNVAACRSNATGYFSICNWSTDGMQVENCNRCPWGVKEGTYCQDENGDVLEPATAGVVDTSYRTATIILAIVLLLVLLILAAVVFILCCKNRKNTKRDSLPGYNSRSAEAATQRPLLQSNFSGESGTPTPMPRTMTPQSSLRDPSLPPKSALRKPPPMLPPPAHLGGSNSVNDTLNTTFNDVPMRPSRSEVV